MRRQPGKCQNDAQNFFAISEIYKRERHRAEHLELTVSIPHVTNARVGMPYFALNLCVERTDSDKGRGGRDVRTRGSRRR